MIFIFSYHEWIFRCGREREVTGQRRVKGRKQLLSSSSSSSRLVWSKWKARRGTRIFSVCHENTEKLDVPTIPHFALHRGYCILTISCDYNFPLFVTDVIRLDGYAMSDRTFNGASPVLESPLTGQWFSFLVIRPACQNNNGGGLAALEEMRVERVRKQSVSALIDALG